MNKSAVAATLLLGIMFLLLLGSAWNDSATFDEVAHIPAGYGYLTQLDYRLNPEHPPLVKVLSAAFVRLFVNPRFPTETQAWQNDVNGQWDQGRIFLYESGNDADKILFWSRLPIMLLTIVFGWFFFRFAQKRYGDAAAIVALALFAFSPTVLAHSRYVTTDLGAAIAFFAGTVAFAAFLKNPSRRNAIITGVVFGLAQLVKFSLFLLAPLYGFLALVWILTRPNQDWSERLRSGVRVAGKIAASFGIGIAVIWFVYGIFVWNYPQARQLRDATQTLANNPIRPLVDFDLALIRNRLARPLGQYLFGFLMASQRTAGGNTTYFLGEVSSKGSHIYFPLMYLVKEPLALHILTIIALLFAIKKIRRGNGRLFQRVRRWIEGNFFEFAALSFIALYWGISIAASLNIGVRHVLPTFPFLFLLISRGVGRWLRDHDSSNPQNWAQWFRNTYQIYVASIPKYGLVFLLMLWIALSTFNAYPHFLAYYSEFIGGSGNGHAIAVDSNLDWGQDLIRLREFMDQRGIQKIALDYFGGGSPAYYLGGRFDPWWSAQGPASGWFAVSATIRQGAFGSLGPGFNRKPEDSYEWLKPHQPIARIGYSLFVYNLP